MKKILMLIILILLTGCTSYTELNNLNIVNSLGIDYKNNKFYIKLSVYQNNDLITYSANGNSFNKALNNIYLESNRKIYLSHLDLLILTPECINSKLDNLINNFITSNEYRNNFQVVLMNSDDLETFYDNNLNSNSIINLININNKETSISAKKELQTFINDIVSFNTSYLPTINLKNTTPTLKGYSLIQNKKLEKELSLNESIILNILTKKAKQAYLANIYIYESDIRIKSKKNIINIEIHLTTNTNNKKKINNLEKQIYAFLEKYKNEDLLRITDYIKKNNYSYYKKEKELTKKIEFKIKIINHKQKDYINGGLNEK